MVMVTGSSEFLLHAQGARCSDSLGVLQNFVISIFYCNVIICILTFAMLVLKIYVTILWVIWMRAGIFSGDQYACEPEKIAKFLHMYFGVVFTDCLII